MLQKLLFMSDRKSMWNFSRQEKIDLIISWVTLSIAFTWLIQSRIIDLPGLGLSNAISFAVPVGFVAVGTGFVFHELAHRQAARHFGFHSEYRAWYPMLGLAVVFAIFTGWILAAPGATYFFGQNVSRKQNGIISAAGPAINLLVGTILLILGYIVADSFFGAVFVLSATINFWFAFFNLLPVFVLDGKKVLHWNPTVWGVLIAIAAIFVFFI
jgi:Zn-dependent protease